jgi:hypothetical protein
MISAWLIEYEHSSRPCWIADLVNHHSFGVTYNPVLAKRFNNPEDARTAMEKLGLSAEWKVVEHYVPSRDW